MRRTVMELSCVLRWVTLYIGAVMCAAFVGAGTVRAQDVARSEFESDRTALVFTASPETSAPPAQN